MIKMNQLFGLNVKTCVKLVYKIDSNFRKKMNFFTGLFRRAILMSGTSLSPMSMCRDPAAITSQVAKILNCPTKTDSELSKCLKQKPLVQ